MYEIFRISPGYVHNPAALARMRETKGKHYYWTREEVESMENMGFDKINQVTYPEELYGVSFVRGDFKAMKSKVMPDNYFKYTIFKCDESNNVINKQIFNKFIELENFMENPEEYMKDPSIFTNIKKYNL